MGERPSYSWRSLLEARPVLQAGLVWRIGNGQSMDIGNNEWIPNVSHHSISRTDDTIFERVSDLIHGDSLTWDHATVHACFEPHVAAQNTRIACDFSIGNIFASSSSGDPYSPIWKALWRAKVPSKVAIQFEKRGYFSVKSAYRIACDFFVGNIFASSSPGNPYSPIWKALWRAEVPSKVAIFRWRAVHNLLRSRAALKSKGEIVGAPPFSIPRSTLRWKDWMLDRATSLALESFDQLLVLLWSIWKYRNDVLWRDRIRPNA
ncbi:uncharacterized protein LOC112163838 [Rosa chinensis]|uniref:uncharacterized protein LOC112163838 n=1 Tax=Rosa chinensis TaxID=74649 RepID=UPI000D08AE2F|nr:uncharacterized protein LOC112163838 [Rosa chinensis]